MHLIVSHSWPRPRMLITAAVQKKKKGLPLSSHLNPAWFQFVHFCAGWSSETAFDSYWSGVFCWSANIWEKTKSCFLISEVSLQSTILIQPLVYSTHFCLLLDWNCRGIKSTILVTMWKHFCCLNEKLLQLLLQPFLMAGFLISFHVKIGFMNSLMLAKSKFIRKIERFINFVWSSIMRVNVIYSE